MVQKSLKIHHADATVCSVFYMQAFQKLHAKEFIHGNFTSSHFKLHSVEEDLEFVFLDLSLADHYHQPFIGNSTLPVALKDWLIL